MNVEMIEKFTNKGKPAAILEGYIYIKDVDLTEGKMRFKCMKYPKCPAYIWVRDGMALSVKGSVVRNDHNHDVEPEKIAARERVRDFKDHAEQPGANIATLVAEARDCEVVVANAMPKSDDLKQIGRRIKRKAIGPAAPIDELRDIEMTMERSKIAIHGPAGDLSVNFLLHDSGADDPNRMLVFGTTNSLATLSRSAKIHADGTFKITPAPFNQVYVLHFEENNKLFPGVFFLLPGRTKALYTTMLQVLTSLCPFEATEVVTDFEYQSMQSFMEVMGVDLHGCYFHFCQAIMKNAKRLNIPGKISRSALKKQHYVMLRALAFLPPAEIPGTFDALVEHIRQHGHYDDFQELLSYVEDTWVAPNCNPNRPALGKFPPAFWSVHTATLTDADRTNNKVEGWHLKIAKFLEHPHLNFYVFLEQLKKFFRAEEDRRREEQRAAANRAARVANGDHLPAARNDYVLRSAELKHLCTNYQNNLYVTHPVSTGLIRFLSEVAEILIRYQ